jgi:Na+/H+ antiporter NhaD/arsenite permease-like protein
LFLTLAVICALRNIKFFTILARKLVTFAGNMRSLFLLLITITFIGSMIIANDMALITFLPLGFFALSVVKQEKYMAYLFVLQNISANLGGMLTPFGNPQNLYLYSYFNIPTGEFCLIMLPAFLLAITMLGIACLFVRPVKFTIDDDYGEKLNIKKTILYCILFFAETCATIENSVLQFGQAKSFGILSIPPDILKPHDGHVISVSFKFSCIMKPPFYCSSKAKKFKGQTESSVNSVE